MIGLRFELDNDRGLSITLTQPPFSPLFLKMLKKKKKKKKKKKNLLFQ